jgi:hypothetical protein
MQSLPASPRSRRRGQSGWASALASLRRQRPGRTVRKPVSLEVGRGSRHDTAPEQRLSFPSKPLPSRHPKPSPYPPATHFPQSAPLSLRVTLSEGTSLQGSEGLPRQRHPDGGHCAASGCADRLRLRIGRAGEELDGGHCAASGCAKCGRQKRTRWGEHSSPGPTLVGPDLERARDRTPERAKREQCRASRSRPAKRPRRGADWGSAYAPLRDQHPKASNGRRLKSRRPEASRPRMRPAQSAGLDRGRAFGI